MLSYNSWYSSLILEATHYFCNHKRYLLFLLDCTKQLAVINLYIKLYNIRGEHDIFKVIVVNDNLNIEL